MKNIKAISLLKKEVEKLSFPTINTLKYLNNVEPVIYLCGKSSTGKTMFLNALFNMDKDELFTSTDISTKTEFRFQFDEVENIINSDGKVINLPTEVNERKELFKLLNKEGDKYIVSLNQKALCGRSIVDIPGVFDFNRNDVFSKQMIDEADIICFFTPCNAKINPFEHELLKSISEAGIPIIVLFTMGDITEVDEGITRKTIPNLVKERLGTCFNGINIFHYQIISSIDFYKGKDTNGIDKLQSHINDNDVNYKKIAERNRLKRTITYYIDLIEKRLDQLKDDSDTFIMLVKRKSQLWIETEKKKVLEDHYKTMSSISADLTWLFQNCEDIIYGKFYNKLFSKQNLSLNEQKEKFQSNWNEFWTQFTEEFNFLQVRVPRLPDFDEDLFKQISIDINSLKELIDKNLKSNLKNKNKKDNSDNKESESKKMSLSSFIEIAKALGVNIDNATILFKKWSFLNSINDIVKNNEKEFIEHCNSYFEIVIRNLGDEADQRIQDELLKDTSKEKFIFFSNTLLNIKNILNDIPTS